MKNLKKVLALGLALVMMLGMFTVASAAETKKTAQEFTDWASVSNKDAVSLMVDLGVINGLPDGTYAPAQTIDRASWAKMVFFVLTGETNGDIYASDYPVLKDISKNWAQGYIEYLYSIDCISGDNLGNYNPSQPISVVAAAKTMLTGLGYNSKIEGYEADANWATNIMNKAKSIGLLKGISLKQNDNISRDAAAQMVYNALSAQTVTAKYTLNFMTGERVPSGEYEKGETLGEKAFEVKAFETTVDDVAKGEAKLANGITGVKASLQDVGKKVTVWCKFDADGDPTEAVSTFVAAASNKPVKTITGGIADAKDSTPSGWNKLFSDANKKESNYVGDALASVTLIKNGVKQTNMTVNAETGAVTNAPTGIGAGDVVEFYADSNGKIDAIHVYDYSVGKAGADVSSKTKGEKTTVTIQDICSNVPVEQISGDWASVKEGDIVLYYTNNKNSGDEAIVYVEKAEKVTGAATFRNKKDNKVTIAGTAYAESGVTGATGENVPDFENITLSNDTEYDFFLDKNGTVCWKNLVKGEVETKVAYVLEAKMVTTSSGWDAGESLQAKLLFTDATTDIVTIAKVYDETDEEFKDAAAADATKIGGALIDYSVNSKGNYEVTVKVAADSANKIASAEIVSSPNFVKNNTSVKADTKTVFIVEKDNGKDKDNDYYTYTGFKALPAMKAGSSVLYAVKDNYVTYAYVKTTGFTGEGSDGLIFIAGQEDYNEGTTANVRVYSIVDAKGNVTTLSVDSSTSDLTAADNVFYVIDSTADDVATLKAPSADWKQVNAGTEAADALAISNGVVTIGAEADAYTYDSSSVCVVIDLGDEVSAGTVSLDTFKVSEDFTYQIAASIKDGNIEYLYVVRTEKAE